MTKRQKRELARLIITGILLIAAVLLFRLLPLDYRNPVFFAIRLAAFAAVFLIVGIDVIAGAARNLLSGRLLDEKFLMTVASVAAFAIGEYPEAVAIVLFYGVGELFQGVAVRRSKDSIKALASLRSDVAHLRAGGDVRDVSPADVAAGSIIEVRPGELIPLDGRVLEGFSLVDAKSLTGESVPVSVGPGDAVFGGTISSDGLLVIETTRELGQSSQEKIISMVENAALNKSKTEQFITKFANVYTPVVVAAAVLIAVIPSLITGDWGRWLRSAIVFLVVSCPCALVVSIPMAFFAGVGKASKRGIMVKGAEYLEALAEAGAAVFDKTGTITSGQFAVAEVLPAAGVPANELLANALEAERLSNHPVSRAVVQYCRENKIDGADGDDVPDGITGTDGIDGLDGRDNSGAELTELSGRGVCLKAGDDRIYAGNRRLANEILRGAASDGTAPGGEAIPDMPDNADGTAIFVFRNERYLGAIILEDTVKPEAAEALDALKRQGVDRLVMLSGDNEKACGRASQAAGIREYKSELLPGDKMDELKKILAENRKKTVYLGDGINDAPVLALADVGIAMGSMGQDAAVEAADCVIMNDDLRKLPEAIAIARKTRRIATENVMIALAAKLLVLIPAILGASVMWAAVFADVGILIIAVLNAMRLMK
ncbi:MAG: heavy metal translocating P-type ATPase [Clostridia bacterium]|nr:heavy metal translocating P-type ATPase [Clostridia bacterium]